MDLEEENDDAEELEEQAVGADGAQVDPCLTSGEGPHSLLIPCQCRLIPPQSRFPLSGLQSTDRSVWR